VLVTRIAALVSMPAIKRVLRLSDVEPEAVEWLWAGRAAAGKLMLLDGDPGLGKSLVTLNVAARWTTARPLPDAPALKQAIDVVLVGGEDAVADTIQPRLRAAGADLARVHHFVSRARPGGPESPPLFPDDCDLLEDTLRETGARVVIIDPLAAALGASASGSHIRQALGHLAAVAALTRVAMILVRHLSKGGSSHRAVYRGSGSIAIIGAARTAFLIAPHPEQDDLRVLACTKNNLSEAPVALGFRIIEHDAGVPLVDWTGPVDLSADDLVRGPGRPPGEALREARDFLKELLQQGACSSGEVYRRALAAGIAGRTLERAKTELRIESCVQTEDGKRRWLWRLPPRAAETVLFGPELEAHELAEAQRNSEAAVAQILARHEKRQAAAAQKAASPPNNHAPRDPSARA
jgi:AAA domain